MKKLAVVLAIMLGLSVLLPMPAMAVDPQSSTIYGDICNDDTIDKDLKQQAGCKEKRELSSVAASIINTVISIVGIVAVAVVIMGGIQYVTSTGDPAKTKKARDTIIWGAIGLVVVILAWVIVSFITSKVPTA